MLCRDLYYRSSKTESRPHRAVCFHKSGGRFFFLTDSLRTKASRRYGTDGRTTVIMMTSILCRREDCGTEINQQSLRFVRKSEEVVGADLVISAKSDEMAERQFVCAAFIACVHRLRGAEKLGDFVLGFVVVLAQVTHAFHVVSHFLPLPFFELFRQIL